jgi:hypothetical protein
LRMPFFGSLRVNESKSASGTWVDTQLHGFDCIVVAKMDINLLRLALECFCYAPWPCCALECPGTVACLASMVALPAGGESIMLSPSWLDHFPSSPSSRTLGYSFDGCPRF